MIESNKFYKKENDDEEKIERKSAFLSAKEEEEDQGEIDEETLISYEDIDTHINIISDQNTSNDQLFQSLQIIVEQSKNSEISFFIYEQELFFVFYQQISESMFANPDYIGCFLTIMANILSLPGEKIINIFLSDFQLILHDIVNEYATGPPAVVLAIFDTFLAVIRPPIDISFFTKYINFFSMYIKIPNPCSNSELSDDLSIKSFQCCNKMFDIKHQGLQKIMLENDFVNSCYKHMNKKTPSFFEACQLLGNIGYLNRYIIEHLPDDFFIDLIDELLQDKDDDIVVSTLKVCESLSTNTSIQEILVKEKQIFNQILDMSSKGFNVKKSSIDLLTTLIESDSVYLEINLIDYGTLDFFADYLQIHDDDICFKALQALADLIRHFITNKINPDSENEYASSPFVSVLQNSEELIDALEELSHDEELPDNFQEASVLAFHLFLECLGIEY